MPKSYDNPRYPYVRSPDQDTGEAHHPVIVVGAGLVGLTAAVDLASRGVPTLVLDDDDTVSFGSRAICFSQRTLEICDRLGIAQRMRDKGVTWNLGKVFFQDRLVYQFNLQPEPGHDWPAFVNLQQYYAEEWLIERATQLELTEIRWKNRVSGVAQEPGGVRLEIDTPDGPYALTCDYLLAADGARSQVRRSMGLALEGHGFEDRFLISDVVMKADFPTERWFWFDPPFHPGQSALLHRQADNVWRIDLQLGRDADPQEEKKPGRVLPRLKAMLGEERDFELDWVSVYTFQCRRLERFRHDQVFFLGDSAHLVSPFGARGGNGGMQDADNLCWKLALVLDGRAPEALLETYDAERIPAADENILNSTRSTDFITPKNAASRALRDAVLELAQSQPFARAMVNSGRLSRPYVLSRSPLNTSDAKSFAGAMAPGAPAADAPVERDGQADWLLRHLGPEFTLIYFTERRPVPDRALQALQVDDVPVRPVVIVASGQEEGHAAPLVDRDGLAAARYDGQPGTCYLIRPDQHVAARFRRFDIAALRAARDRALARVPAVAAEGRAVMP
jgi:3-(3-hydroxy-phenyl)propionate hydroxylase